MGEHGFAPATEACPSDDGGSCTRLWLSGEYLLWWTKKSPEPVPLVTTGSLADVRPGALGQPGTRVVLGGNSIDREERSGGRFTVGGWLDGDRTIGVEASYFFLASRSTTSSVSTGPGAPVLAVPIFDVSGLSFPAGAPHESTFQPFNVLLFVGGPVPVTFRAEESLRTRLQGAEANGLFNLVNGSGLRVNVLAGFRYLTLQDDFSFATNSQVTTNPGFFNTVDSFKSDNDFYGGQVGLKAEYGLGGLVNGLSVSAAAKVALGDMHERVDVAGQTAANQFTGLGGPAFFPGGIFAQPSNIGTHSHDRFAVVPEVDFSAAYDVTRWARAFVGYSFLYASDVARAGDQLNHNINPTRTGVIQAIAPALATGPAEPAFNLRESSFWAQGINFGLEFRY